MADNFSRIADVIDESERNRGVNDELLTRAPAERPGRAKSQMISVRIPLEAAGEIEQLAQKSDVPVSALVRGWILEGLAAHSASLPRQIDKIEAELGRLRGMVQ